MIIEIPDIDIDKATEAELKAQAAICAMASNSIQSRAIDVHLRLITMRNADYVDDLGNAKKVQEVYKPRLVRRKTAKEILGGDDVEEMFSINDFK